MTKKLSEAEKFEKLQKRSKKGLFQKKELTPPTPPSFEPETIIKSHFWSVVEIVKRVKEEKDDEGNIVRTGFKEVKLVEFFDNESRKKYILNLREELEDNGEVRVLVDNYTGFLTAKLVDDLEYYRKRVQREEVRLNNEA